MFQALCTRNSRPPRENVCGRGLSDSFDEVAVSKIHFNVIFSKQPRETNSRWNSPQKTFLPPPPLYRCRAFS